MADLVKILNVKANIGDAEQKLGKLQRSVKRLQSTKRALNQAVKKGIITQKQYDKAIGRNTIATKKAQMGVRQYSKSILAANGAMSKTSGFVIGIRKALTGMAVQFMGVMAAFALIKNVIGTFKDFEQANADLASVLGKTTDEIKDLSIEAKKYGSTTKFTASEVSGLQKEFAKLGFSVKEIKNATKATLDLAAATNTDLARAAEVAGATVRGFGLDASETQRVTDVMAKSFSSSALDMEKFATSMRAVAPVARNAGLNIEQTTSMLGILVDRGVEASTAGTSLRNVFLELSKKGLTFEEAMQKINQSTDKNKTSLELFGKRGAVTGTILAETGVQVSELEIKLNNAGGAAERMAETQLDTLSGKLTILNSAWEGFILGLEDGEGVLSGLLEGITELATSFLGVLTPSEKLSENLNEQRVTMNTLALRITDANIAEADRAKLIDELNTKYPEFNEHLLTEKTTNEEIAIAVSKVNEQLINKILIQRKEEEFVEQIEKTANAREKQLEIELAINRQIAVAAEELKRQGKEIDLTNLSREQRIDLLIKELKPLRERLKTSKLGNEEYNLEGQIIISLQSKRKALTEAQEELNEENLKGNAIQKEKEEILKLLGIETEKNLEVTEEETVETEKGNLTLAQRIALITQLQIDEAGLFSTRVKGIEEILAAEEALREFQGEGYNVFAGETEEEIIEDSDFLIAEYQKTFEGKQQLLDIALANEEISEAEYRHKKKLLDDKQLEEEITRAEKEKQFKLNAVSSTLNALQSFQDSALQRKLQGVEKGSKQEEAILKKAAARRKVLAVIEVAINLAKELSAISAAAAANPTNNVTFGIAGITQSAILSAIAITKSAAQVAAINAQQFAQGGVLRGKSHARGGIPTMDGQYEFEGGEAVINKRSTARYGALLSHINQAGGGVSFGKGGVTKFQDGGLSAPSMALSDIGDNGANDITQEVTSQVGALKVINVVSETTEAQNSILNVQSEAEIG